MSRAFLIATVLLAFGPLAVMLLLYAAALLLRLAGRPRLLAALVKGTQVPQPLDRADGDAAH